MLWIPIIVAIGSVLFIVLCIAFYNCYLRATDDELKEISVKSPTGDRHHWTIVEAFEPGHFCNVCGTGAFRGARCDYCGIVVDAACVREARKFKCKELSSNDPELLHHWVQGNLPFNSVCEVCNDDCGDGPGLRDFKCCWCQRSVHTKCKGFFDPGSCDLGKFRTVIVPPNCVRLKTVGWKGRRHTVVSEVIKPDNVNDWRPLIVVANRKSGNGEGDLILQTFRRLLNPVQVLDLADVPPEVSLSWCRLVKPGDVRCRILVAGGDGTVGWILSCIERMLWPNPDQKPDVRPLPLGTGNDLSRVLGWGPAHVGELDGEKLLNETTLANMVLLDRWSIKVDPAKSLGIRRPSRYLKMNNYVSVGVDALVTLNMDRRRYKIPRVMSGRLMNKFLFFTYGTKDVLERACKHLSRFVSIRLDDGPKLGDDGDSPLPDLEAIVLLNIPSWGAGVRLYELGYHPNEHPPQAMDDGKLEVLGLYSSFHMAQLTVGLSEPYRFGQAQKVEITIRGGCHLPMQIDGEPWTQGPATITIIRHGQARLLAANRRSSNVGEGTFYLS